MSITWKQSYWTVLLLALFCATGASSARAQRGTADHLPPDPPIASHTLESLQGLVVHQVVLVDDAPNAAADRYHTDEQRLLERLLTKSGDRLDATKVRDDLRTLYASGRFDNIALQTVREGDQVALRYHYVPRYFVGMVYVVGSKTPPTVTQLINSAKLSLGEAVTEQKLQDSVRRMQRTLRDNGWYQATITVAPLQDPNTQEEQITFIVHPGTQARVGNIVVQGKSAYTAAQIERIAKLHPGDHVTAARISRALSRLRKKLQKNEHLEASADLARPRYNPASNTVDYTFTVEQGSKIEVKVEGAAMSGRLVKKYVPVFEEHAVDEDLLNEGVRNLRDYYQSKGYFDVRVHFTQKPEAEGREAIIFRVDRGDRHKVMKLDITGNTYFSDEDIRERMLISAADLLQRQGRFSQAALNHDVSAIEDLYHSNGFAQVKVDPIVDDNYEGKNGHLAVTLRITEGPQTRVGKVTVNGVTSFARQEIESLMGESAGQPYSEFNVAADRDAILGYYYNQGFGDARMDSVAKPVANSPDRVDLTYNIVEGERTYVDRTLIYGLKFTRPFIVQQESEIVDGAPLDRSALLDTQRRLYDLSLFNEVDEAVQNPEGGATYKNVILKVDEARRWTLNYGLGFEAQTGQSNGNCTKNASGQTSASCNPQGGFGFSPRVSFDVSRINFRGRDQTITFRSNFGRLQKRALLSFEAPRLFNQPSLTFTTTAFYDNTQDVRTFTAKRLEGSAQVRQQYSKATTFVYRYTYRKVSVDQSTLFISPSQVPLLSLPVRVGMPTFTLIRDTRDDPLDSHRGTYNSADFGVSSTFFGSRCTNNLIPGQNTTAGQRCPDPSFSRTFVQNSSYYPFGKSANRKWVFARSTRIGTEATFGYLGGLVPLAERFYAGGSDSHRGFALNQAGPRDNLTGFPIGGDAQFINNFELRTPALELPFVGDNLSAVLFHDMGNNFSTTQKMWPGIFRFSQPHIEDCRTSAATACDLNYNSQAIGAGIRYRTPVGPVRIDVGYNLNPPLYHRMVTDPNDPTQQIFQTTHTQRINLSFSIGQTF